MHFFLVSLSFSFVPPVLDKFIPEYLGPEFKMIGFSFPSRGFIYSHATVTLCGCLPSASSVLRFLWDIPSSTHLKPNAPCSLNQNQITLSLTTFLSTKKEFYKLSSRVIFGSPTLHPTTQGFLSSLPITYLIVLFPLLPLLFRPLHLCLFVCLNNETLNKPTHCCQLTSSNTTSILPSLYL